MVLEKERKKEMDLTRNECRRREVAMNNFEEINLKEKLNKSIKNSDPVHSRSPNQARPKHASPPGQPAAHEPEAQSAAQSMTQLPAPPVYLLRPVAYDPRHCSTALYDIANSLVTFYNNGCDYGDQYESHDNDWQWTDNSDQNQYQESPFFSENHNQYQESPPVPEYPRQYPIINESYDYDYNDSGYYQEYQEPPFFSDNQYQESSYFSENLESQDEYSIDDNADQMLDMMKISFELQECNKKLDELLEQLTQPPSDNFSDTTQLEEVSFLYHDKPFDDKEHEPTPPLVEVVMKDYVSWDNTNSESDFENNEVVTDLENFNETFHNLSSDELSDTKMHEPTPPEPELEVVVEDDVPLNDTRPENEEVEIGLERNQINLNEPITPKVGEVLVEVKTTSSPTTLSKPNAEPFVVTNVKRLCMYKKMNVFISRHFLTTIHAQVSSHKSVIDVIFVNQNSKDILFSPTNDPPIVGNLFVINTIHDHVYEHTANMLSDTTCKLENCLPCNRSSILNDLGSPLVMKKMWKKKQDFTFIRRSKVKWRGCKKHRARKFCQKYYAWFCKTRFRRSSGIHKAKRLGLYKVNEGIPFDPVNLKEKLNKSIKNSDPVHSRSPNQARPKHASPPGQPAAHEPEAQSAAQSMTQLPAPPVYLLRPVAYDPRHCSTALYDIANSLVTFYNNGCDYGDQYESHDNDWQWTDNSDQNQYQESPFFSENHNQYQESPPVPEYPRQYPIINESYDYDYNDSGYYQEYQEPPFFSDNQYQESSYFSENLESQDEYSIDDNADQMLDMMKISFELQECNKKLDELLEQLTQPPSDNFSDTTQLEEVSFLYHDKPFDDKEHEPTPPLVEVVMKDYVSWDNTNSESDFENNEVVTDLENFNETFHNLSSDELSDTKMHEPTPPEPELEVVVEDDVPLNDTRPENEEVEIGLERNQINLNEPITPKVGEVLVEVKTTSSPTTLSKPNAEPFVVTNVKRLCMYKKMNVFISRHFLTTIHAQVSSHKSVIDVIFVNQNSKDILFSPTNDPPIVGNLFVINTIHDHAYEHTANMLSDTTCKLENCLPCNRSSILNDLGSPLVMKKMWKKKQDFTFIRRSKVKWRGCKKHRARKFCQKYYAWFCKTRFRRSSGIHKAKRLGLYKVNEGIPFDPVNLKEKLNKSIKNSDPVHSRSPNQARPKHASPPGQPAAHEPEAQSAAQSMTQLPAPPVYLLRPVAYDPRHCSTALYDIANSLVTFYNNGCDYGDQYESHDNDWQWTDNSDQNQYQESPFFSENHNQYQESPPVPEYPRQYPIINESYDYDYNDSGYYQEYQEPPFFSDNQYQESSYFSENLESQDEYSIDDNADQMLDMMKISFELQECNKKLDELLEQLTQPPSDNFSDTTQLEEVSFLYHDKPFDDKEHEPTPPLVEVVMKDYVSWDNTNSESDFENNEVVTDLENFNETFHNLSSDELSDTKMHEPTPPEPELEVVVEDDVPLNDTRPENEEVEIGLERNQINLNEPITPKVGEVLVEVKTTSSPTTLSKPNAEPFVVTNVKRLCMYKKMNVFISRHFLTTIHAQVSSHKSVIDVIFVNQNSKDILFSPTNDPPIVGNLFVINTIHDHAYEHTANMLSDTTCKLENCLPCNRSSILNDLGSPLVMKKMWKKKQDFTFIRRSKVKWRGCKKHRARKFCQKYYAWFCKTRFRRSSGIHKAKRLGLYKVNEGIPFDPGGS
ncbi:hypothetical protein LXL04_033225 [Taraxacum kok-saghyz]